MPASSKEERIAIMTDSTCDLDKETVEKLGIFILPLRVVYGDKDLRDGIDIAPDEVYSRMPGEVPKTSLPSPGEIVKAFEEIREQGFTHVIALHLSSGLSGTLDLVRSIGAQFKGLCVEVVDSKSLSLGLGFPVLEAAQAVFEKASLPAVIERAKTAIKKINTFYVIETLEYLKKGGRIGKVSGTIGEFLNIKPVISIDADGVYYTHAKVRGRQKSLDKLVEIVKERVSQKVCKIAVMHGGALKEAEDLISKIKVLPNIREIVRGQISPVLGVHTGPGLVGVCIYTLE